MHLSIKQVAKNTMTGIAMAPWLIIGGFMLCLTIYGSVLGIPMILLGLSAPFIEMYLAWRGDRWTGEHVPDNDEVGSEPDWEVHHKPAPR